MLNRVEAVIRSYDPVSSFDSRGWPDGVAGPVAGTCRRPPYDCETSLRFHVPRSDRCLWQSVALRRWTRLAGGRRIVPAGSDPDVRILATHQLTPELSQTVSQTSSVIFLDAARSGAPGEIVLTSLLPERPGSVFTHDFSPGGILNLSHNLYGRCPQATLASVCGECFEHGDSVSRTVEAALPSLVARIIELVKAAGQV